MQIKRNHLHTLALWLVILFTLAGLACAALTELPARVFNKEIVPATTAVPSVPVLPSVSPLPSWTITPGQSSTPAPSLEFSATPLVENVDSAAFQVRFHPDDALYVGDQVSIEVISPPGLELEEVQVSVALESGFSIGDAEFERFGIAGRRQATLTWAWDTRGFAPGEYTLQFTFQPGDTAWRETVELLPAQQLPDRYADAKWAQAASECCLVHYITGTAAERDLDQLLAEMDRQAQDVEGEFNAAFEEPVSMILLPRLLGHGGFASGEIHVSYLDRNYASGAWQLVTHHEMVHIMDSRLGGDFRPSLFVEGLAVYLTGGHFKPEPLMPRAAALLDSWGNPPQPGLDWYLPLAELADDFYAAQHETSYLQAAALVEYMVDTFGWDAFISFYRSIQPDPENSQASAIDLALQEHLGLSLDQLETDFLVSLRQFQADPKLAADVRQVVQFFNAVRRYQQLLDPSAYFRTAWLLDTGRMRQEGIVADYLRHPDELVNLTLETMLVSTGDFVAQGHTQDADAYLSAVNQALDALEAGEAEPFKSSQIASDYHTLVQLVRDNPQWVGAAPDSQVAPQRISLAESSARVWLSVGSAQLIEVQLGRDSAGSSWRFLSYSARSSNQPSRKIKETPRMIPRGLSLFSWMDQVDFSTGSYPLDFIHTFGFKVGSSPAYQI